jgi:nucleotide-binding universal stress UspA family protein
MSPDKLGIVVGVDGSPASTVAIEWAARDAGMRDVALRLVHVVPSATGEEFRPETFAQSEIARWRRDSRRRIIEDAHKVAVDASPTRHASQVTSEVLYGPVVPALVALSEKADMVVVGCPGQSALARVLLGSVSSGLVHHAHCPVAVVHDEDRLAACSSQAPVVLGVDGSPTSELATALAFDEASRRGVTLVALHAWSENVDSGSGTPVGRRSNGPTAKSARKKSSPNGCRDGGSATRMSWCTRLSSATGRHFDCSSRQTPPSCWSSAATVAAQSPARCWVRSAGRS